MVARIAGPGQAHPQPIEVTDKTGGRTNPVSVMAGNPKRDLVQLRGAQRRKEQYPNFARFEFTPGGPRSWATWRWAWLGDGMPLVGGRWADER